MWWADTAQISPLLPKHRSVHAVDGHKIKVMPNFDASPANEYVDDLELELALYAYPTFYIIIIAPLATKQSGGSLG